MFLKGLVVKDPGGSVGGLTEGGRGVREGGVLVGGGLYLRRGCGSSCPGGGPGCPPLTQGRLGEGGGEKA